MKPPQRVPLIVASGLAAPLPGVPQSALASTSATMTSATIQNTAPFLGLGRAKWLAEPMKNSMGMERSTLVREASPPRAPAGAAAGLAGLPAAVSMAFWITILFLGQITNQTLAHMTEPRMPPSRMAQPYEPAKKPPWPNLWSTMSQPARNVTIALQRNHQSARGSSFCWAPERTAGSVSAKNGTWTKLK